MRQIADVTTTRGHPSVGRAGRPFGQHLIVRGCIHSGKAKMPCADSTVAQHPIFGDVAMSEAEPNTRQYGHLDAHTSKD